MTRHFALGIAAAILIGCIILTGIWWSLLAANMPPFDRKLTTILVIMAIIQVASWVAVFRLWLRARAIHANGFALYVGSLDIVLLLSHLINGFTPALGMPVTVLVLAMSVPGFVMAKRLTRQTDKK
jgi:hypothetical protein